jgi:hypothetical protein
VNFRHLSIRNDEHLGGAPTLTHYPITNSISAWGKGNLIFLLPQISLEKISFCCTSIHEGNLIKSSLWPKIRIHGRRKIPSNFYSLPVMFERNLKRREVIRGFADAFGGCSAGIRRLEKKIASHQEFNFSKNQKFSDILSFYQVYESLPNNLQTNQQGLQFQSSFSVCFQTSQAMNFALLQKS